MARPAAGPGTAPSTPRGGGMGPRALPSTGSAPALQKRALPCQRVRDDGREIVVSRLPSERGTRALACRDDLRGIARPAAGEFDREIHAGDPLYGLDHVEHGEAAAVAAIERARGAAAAQVSERGAMRGDEIGHVNIVPDAGTVRRRIVGAEHVDLRAPS